MLYSQRIHDKCYRRSHFDAGQFVEKYDDENAKKGYCLYKVGCKGPTTYNACSTIRVMIITGLALYAEGQGTATWWYDAFGWIIPLFGQSQDVHTWHHLGMWYTLIFVMIHIYIVIREDIMSRQSLISTMINGWRTWKDDRR